MSLNCPHCGMILPDSGYICPFCQANVGELKAYHASTSAAGVLAFIVASPAFYFFGFWVGAIAWLIAVAFIGHKMRLF